MTPMKTTLMTSVLFLLAGSLSHAQIRPGPRPVPLPVPRPPIPRPIPQPRKDVVRTVTINRAMTNGVLSIRKMAGLGDAFRDHKLKSVVVELRGGPFAQLELLVDGRVESTVRAQRGPVVLKPQRLRELGRGDDDIKVRLKGMAIVEKFTVTLAAPDNDQQQAILLSAQINSHTQGQERFNLARYFDMNQLRGYKVQAVMVKGEAEGPQNAVVDLLINGFKTDAATFNRLTDEKNLKANQLRLGNGADSLVLVTKGKMHLRKVTLKLAR